MKKVRVDVAIVGGASLASMAPTTPSHGPTARSRPVINAFVGVLLYDKLVPDADPG
jgi:hypothetical protein